ncbi:hypothetical protein BOS5A_200843 [Bosea sp. EC-HK365B]|nr:hypothetical protein BOSE7B_40424 [Bosea sp. 7B]VVT58954.1 hypothetical protein BOS5A_200843 [Bosea sp. EC-HK365B]
MALPLILFSRFCNSPCFRSHPPDGARLPQSSAGTVIALRGEASVTGDHNALDWHRFGHECDHIRPLEFACFRAGLG